MITPAQIQAQSITPALTADQVFSLEMLVKQYAGYVNNLALFPNLALKLAAEVTTPTVKTKGLKAVLAASDALPNIEVESQGRDTAPSHFSAKGNWDYLALDVLNVLYELPASLLTPQRFALGRMPIDELTLARKTLGIDWESGNTLGLKRK